MSAVISSVWGIDLERNKPFQKLSCLVIAGFLFLALLVAVAASFFSMAAFQKIFFVMAAVLLLFFFTLVFGFFSALRILSSQNSFHGGKSSLSARLALKVFMPVLLAFSSIFHYKKDEIRRVYIQANNESILAKRVRPDKMLVILPHCLQQSKCGYRIRDGLGECRQCGSCNLGRIKQLAKDYGVQVALATGGTSARKIILDAKPELVIAVACERDLSSGIMDVRGLPVYGILNQRPNGPCKDTLVDLEELEDMIKHFTQSENNTVAELQV